MQVEKVRELQNKSTNLQSELLSTIDGPTNLPSKHSCDTVTERDDNEIDQSVHSQALQLHKSIDNTSQFVDQQLEELDSVSIISENPDLELKRNVDLKIAEMEKEIKMEQGDLALQIKE